MSLSQTTKNRIKSLVETVRAREEEIAEMAQQYEIRLTELGSALDTLRKLTDALRDQFNACAGERDALYETNAAMQGTIYDLKATVMGMEEKLDRLRRHRESILDALVRAEEG